MEEFATMLRGLQVHFAGWQALMRHSGWDRRLTLCVQHFCRIERVEGGFRACGHKR